ncbi:hypothetical protein COV16_00615 [Candidatus Woesearchaeota archaeon CG10_big_fil_rev_8_21_14_0_10_34_8]|nr:MAG: hypothetical protein COV16_00615 [Candidatus Woesearchaeota archaeon CG10_big_fil_rev_8_21_14_0_10_34_8]
MGKLKLETEMGYCTLFKDGEDVSVRGETSGRGIVQKVHMILGFTGNSKINMGDIEFKEICPDTGKTIRTIVKKLYQRVD